MMKINSTLTQAMAGIHRGMASARQHAQEIASADSFTEDSPSSLIEPLVGLTQDQLQVSASTAVLKAVDAMIGTLLDEKA